MIKLVCDNFSGTIQIDEGVVRQVTPETIKPEEKPSKPKTMTGKPKKVDRGRVGALYRGGWSIDAIADDVGCSTVTVRNIIHELGLTGE